MDQVKQAQKDGVVLGLKGVSSKPVLRRDIDDLIVNYPDTFNLFLLALSDLQKDDQIDDKMGYQQIAGIHGLPMTYWDNVKAPGRDQGAGYCAHGIPTFPTWHRPYLAMMEQTIYAKMNEIVGQYKSASQPKYRAALQEFRLPFWDYYRPRTKGITTMPGIVGPGGTTTYPYDFSLPQIFCIESVMVRYPDDDTKLNPLDNPLYKYTFSQTGAKKGGMTAADWDMAPDYSQIQTVRYPTSTIDLKGNQTRQSYVLNKEREGNVKMIMNMIRDDAYASYATFASDSITDGGFGNLEGIHGAYHMAIGGDPQEKDENGTPDRMGHMSYVPTAAYDPIFWMHHCLIDRWTAIWQAARPDKWYDGQYYTDRDDPTTKTDVSTLLKVDHLPFRHPEGGFWNGSTSRNTKDFGYEYKDAIGSSDQVKRRFYDLYRWALRYDAPETPPPIPEEMKPFNVLAAPVFNYSSLGTVGNSLRQALERAPHILTSAMETTASAAQEIIGSATPFAQTAESVEVDTNPVVPGTATSDIALTNMEGTPLAVPAPADLDESKYYRDWYVDHRVKRLALNGSFAIYWFLGNFDRNNAADYAVQPTMAGLNYIFAAPREACDNCGIQDDADHLIADTKIITPMLMDYVKKTNEPLQDLTPASVVPFLIKNLKWRIVGPEGQAVDPRALDGFKVGVSSKLGPRDPDSQEPSIYEEYPQVIERIIQNAS